MTVEVLIVSRTWLNLTTDDDGVADLGDRVDGRVRVPVPIDVLVEDVRGVGAGLLADDLPALRSRLARVGRLGSRRQRGKTRQHERYGQQREQELAQPRSPPSEQRTDARASSRRPDSVAQGWPITNLPI